MNRFQFLKTAQAISTLLRFHNTKDMSYLRLLKVMYIADRESIRQTGHPITGDRVVAMERGPVLDSVYKLIKGEHVESPQWSEYFHTVGYRIEMIREPGNGRLSRGDVGILREVTKRYEDLDEWQMVDVTHEFPEWIANDPGKSSRVIPFEQILEAVGQSANREAILTEARDNEIFDRLFAGKSE